MRVFNKEMDLKKHAIVVASALLGMAIVEIFLSFFGRYNGSIALVFLVLLTGCILNKVYE